ncbi:MAG: hypothetical protein DI536_23650 [Archangium gephyra]|uniref:Uncharacterized protein n=1 Tax=Archangium gephyra TaxID=48 RepID=A0A2W5UIR8_9BACT|nr:MAG: hypothetical protein DI536_23650 [Archangium gephyra]
MEMPESGPKQRPAWLYVLLGCGGAAGLVCLIGALAMGYCAKSVNDLNKGVTDPEVRKENALKQLGAIPEGYTVVMSASMFVAQVTVLTDAAMLDDGGFQLEGKTHSFMYQRVMANENNKAIREFLQGKTTDEKSALQLNLRVNPASVVKRGSLTVDGRKFAYIASRSGPENGEPQDVLNTTVLFECPGDVLHVGVWTQMDPEPDKANEALDLAGTVADEAELARFLKPMNPCGR